MHSRNHQIEKEIKSSPQRHTPPNRERENCYCWRICGDTWKIMGQKCGISSILLLIRKLLDLQHMSRILFFHSRDNLHHCPNQQKNQLFLGLLNLISFNSTNSYHLTSAITHVSHPILKLLSKGKTKELENSLPRQKKLKINKLLQDNFFMLEYKI